MQQPADPVGWLVNRQESVLVWVEDLDQARPCSHWALCGTGPDMPHLEDLPGWSGPAQLGPQQNPAWTSSPPSEAALHAAAARLLCIPDAVLWYCCSFNYSLILKDQRSQPSTAAFH